MSRQRLRADLSSIYEHERIITPQALEPRGGVSQALSVVCKEPTHGPWTKNNNIGQVVSFAPDASLKQRILQLPEWGRPRVWSLVLGLEYERSIGAPFNPPLYWFQVLARVTFGSGGTTTEFEADWKDGTVLSVPCNALNVEARYTFPFGVPTFPSKLQLSAHLAEGAPAFRPFGATRTYYSEPAGSEILIPPFAQSITAVSATASGAHFVYDPTTEFIFYTGLGAAMGVVTGDQLSDWPNGFPVPLGSSTLQVRSTAANPIPMNVIFSLPF